MGRQQSNQRADLYSRITDTIIAELEQGVRPWVRPWVKPWNSGPVAGGITRPLRHNGQPYSGINVLLLWSEAIARGFASSTWMTFRQAIELGGAVRKGETGTTVVFASSFMRRETSESGEELEQDIPFLKSYTVFNLDQITGLDERFYDIAPVQDPLIRIGDAGRFFANTGAMIRHGGTAAYYVPARDYIQMPAFDAFMDDASYVAVLSHEMTHWTASPRRLDRDLSRYARDRSERAREELIAELGSCFLCADLGIVPELQPRPDHASYLASWLEVLGCDKRAIFTAAAHAQRAVDYLHHLQPDVDADHGEGEGDGDHDHEEEAA
ncbi:zincin-like metallopeptidase domain-containing protein [Rhizobium sp. BK251]|uniref:ArdC family protein n=1 Tax=Rhizobium sp. BK251 TaxID=2512125 RepID=UPI00104D5EC5|nr:zincin-like metallopeptidase domain-containing protein [Rhizobium sp. BK251]TCL62513.1 antirestriction protein ArdC [Rhizobium sp. BK251]